MATNPSHLCVHLQSTHTICNWLCCLCLQKGLWRFLEMGPGRGTCFGWWDITKCDTWRGLKRASVLEFALFCCSWQLCYHPPMNEPRVACWMTVTRCPVSSAPPTDNQPTPRGVWGHQLTANAVPRPEDTHRHEQAISDEFIPLHWCKRTMSY